jgi:hypothetical protein
VAAPLLGDRPIHEIGQIAMKSSREPGLTMKSVGNGNPESLSRIALTFRRKMSGSVVETNRYTLSTVAALIAGTSMRKCF